MDDNVYIASIVPRPITSYSKYMYMCVPSLTEGGGGGMEECYYWMSTLSQSSPQALFKVH